MKKSDMWKCIEGKKERKFTMVLTVITSGNKSKIRIIRRDYYFFEFFKL